MLDGARSFLLHFLSSRGRCFRRLVWPALSLEILTSQCRVSELRTMLNYCVPSLVDRSQTHEVIHGACRVASHRISESFNNSPQPDLDRNRNGSKLEKTIQEPRRPVVESAVGHTKNKRRAVVLKSPKSKDFVTHNIEPQDDLKVT